MAEYLELISSLEFTNNFRAFVLFSEATVFIYSCFASNTRGRSTPQDLQVGETLDLKNQNLIISIENRYLAISPTTPEEEVPLRIYRSGKRRNKSDDDAKEIDQSSVNTTSTEMKNSNDTSASNISDNTSNSDVAPERIENSSNNTPDSDPYQEKDSRSFTSPIPIGTLSSEEKEINEFLELQEKERVSNMERERNREKKICRGQQLVRKTSSSSDTQNAISTEINPIIETTHDHKTTRLESMPTDQAQNTGIKISYNKRVEQVLRHDLSVFIKENINNKVSEVFDIQTPEFSLEVIITGSSKITAQNIADLFVIAMKVRQKEILCWYCYYKAYEDRTEDIKRVNKIDDQSARTLVYNKIKALLLDIIDVNLRQRTFRAKNIYVTS
ncbi:4108_t:CDS:2 [Acaulospora morrowiae]|uniref:4108_t:CDS:1 n=1 Tax=Acaulospora morrowiae TaxID=94023 RepID=A0A9N9BVD3_9GLOM|nr:4108_t:CDS:2 [Acaulospora morrowiae]